MRIPKKILEKFIQMVDAEEYSLSKFNKNTGKWEKVKFDPNNEEHMKFKEMHLAETEILCVIEGLKCGILMTREMD
tara:strand:- start:6758 stop:6985 length:228 start_codon:yes stop_codon:yes gene_type:complete